MAHGLLVERRQHVAARVETLRHLDAQLAGDDRLEAADHAIAVGARAPSQLEHVAKAHRGDQAAHDTLALEDGIGADRGAVHQRNQRLGGETAVADAGHHATRLIVGSRGDLGDAELALAFIHEEQISERSADVDASLPLPHAAMLLQFRSQFAPKFRPKASNRRASLHRDGAGIASHRLSPARELHPCRCL